MVKRVHGALAAAKAKARPQFDQKYPSKLPVLEQHPQKELKKLMPPGGLSWRSRTDGAWCGRWQQMTPWSARDSVWGSDIMAVRAVFRHVWIDFLDMSGFTLANCPIIYLLYEGAGGLPAV